MEEMESKFTGVHGTNRSVGMIPHLQGVDLPVGRRIPELGEALVVDLRQGGGRGGVEARGWMGKNEPFFPTLCPKYDFETAPAGVSGTYPGVSGPPESPGCKPWSLRPP
jgi:hypothetical protein